MASALLGCNKHSTVSCVLFRTTSGGRERPDIFRRHVLHVRIRIGDSPLEPIERPGTRPSAAYLILPRPLRIFPLGERPRQKESHSSTLLRDYHPPSRTGYRSGFTTWPVAGSCWAQIFRRVGPVSLQRAAEPGSACHRNKAWR